VDDVIALENVSRWYGSVLGVNRVDLEFRPGVTALLGPNGAGKSTLLRIIVGVLRPSVGTVSVNGLDPFANPTVYRRLGIVPEEAELYVRASAMEWLVHLLRLRGMDLASARELARRGLADVGLHDVRDRRVTSLSRGMKQRLRIAQAIAHDPSVITLDEPLTALDPVGRHEVIGWIREWGERGKTVVVSSHILHEVEMMTREVVLMMGGKVLASGNVHDIRRLLDAHPHRITIRTHTPRALAERLLQKAPLSSVSFSEQSGEVSLETSDPEPFYELVSELVLEEGVDVEEMVSPDDNLEAVFRYLVGGDA
jgi:ABC-2 type transport system ATP-binding protein